MAENIVDQIFSSLRQSVPDLYRERGECKAVRPVGHTPKPEYYLYEAVLEFAQGQARISAKVYRGKGKETAKAQARQEYQNLLAVQEAFARRKLTGAPRPLGDFCDCGAVVAEKVPGLPLQSIIMKAALLPGYADHEGLRRSARATGEWLRNFHKTMSQGAMALDTGAILEDLEVVSKACKREGLEDGDVKLILSGAEQSLAKAKKTTVASAVLHEFSPLNVSLSEDQVFLTDYSAMEAKGMALLDVGHFMAAIEALEKYPFCNREITSSMQEDFLTGYGAAASDRALVRVLKMRELLRMFAAGRNVKDTAVRKKVMWANVMKKFIHEAANRTLSQAA